MASTGKCKYCGAVVSSDESYCPNCGAPNEGFVTDSGRRIITPSTIEELKEYCAERNMPLLRMRFFIGEDHREPKAYGIYKDGNDFIVYKNKSDGQRAIRYQGPDEAHAVNELYLKLMAECRLRGISSDGRIKETAPVWIQENTSEKLPEKTSGRMGSSRKISPEAIAFLVFLALIYLIYNISESSFEEYHGSGGFYYPDRGPVSYPYQNGFYYSYNSYGDSWYGEDDWKYEDDPDDDDWDYEDDSDEDEWDYYGNSGDDEDDFADNDYDDDYNDKDEEEDDDDVDYYYSGADDRDSDRGSSSRDTDTWSDSFDSPDSGDDWDSDWGSSFDDSDTWDNSFDSWDSGDTDWDSDW